MRIAQGTRSGLWLTITEGIRVLAPKVIVVENVAALRSRGIAKVCGDLAALGYSTAWVSLCAAHVGAAHRGYVTGLGLPRTAELKALGNGVVPQQAEAAIRWLIAAACE